MCVSVSNGGAGGSGIVIVRYLTAGGAPDSLVVNSTGLDTSGGVKVGYDSVTCTSTKVGTQRYSPTTGGIEVCNGTSWTSSSSNNIAYARLTGAQGWKTQGNAWQELNTGYRVSLNKRFSSSLLRINLTENVGINTGGYWCSLGVAMDGAMRPECVWDWYQGYNHNHYTVSCMIPNVSAGVHNFQVWDKGGYCYYGNYPWEYGNRQLVIEELP